MKPVPTPRRRGVSGVVFGLLFFCFFLLMASPFPGYAKNDARGARAYQERAAAEQNTRYRYRRLEWASLVLILAAGGAAIFWAVRRRK
ncbi:MAG: hypothetical protein R3239_06310 [Thermodesulfobacteriota bacterium]|nr:hypothetical protein [Thermodesulfobacteriota bacterium]